MRSATIMLVFVLLLSPLPLLAQTLYEFEVDTTRSSITLQLEASISGISDSDEASSRLSGVVEAWLTPMPTSIASTADAWLTSSQASFSSIQITEMNVTMHDEIALRLDFGAIIGRLDVMAPPEEVNLLLVEAGDAAAVIDTSFVQETNTVIVSGTLQLSATGVLSLGVGGPTDLETELTFDIPGSVTESDDMVQLRLPLSVVDTTEVSGVPLVISIDGIVVAMAERVGTIAENVDRPFRISLSQNYPNPFNPSTSISFTIDQPGPVTLRVYDALGRLVATLVDTSLPAGTHETVFDGSGLSSGVYVYRLTARGGDERRSMVLLK